jgi:hypothetical protein
MGAVPISVIMGFDYPLEDSVGGRRQLVAATSSYFDNDVYLPETKKVGQVSIRFRIIFLKILLVKLCLVIKYFTLF